MQFITFWLLFSGTISSFFFKVQLSDLQILNINNGSTISFFAEICNSGNNWKPCYYRPHPITCQILLQTTPYHKKQILQVTLYHRPHPGIDHTLLQATTYNIPHPIKSYTFSQASSCHRPHPVKGQSLLQAKPHYRSHPITGHVQVQITPYHRPHPITSYTF